MADTDASKASARKGVRVRLPSPVQNQEKRDGEELGVERLLRKRN